MSAPVPRTMSLRCIGGALLMALAACSPTPSGPANDQAPAATPSAPSSTGKPPAAPVPSASALAPAPATSSPASSAAEDEAIRRVSEAVKKHHLTDLAETCVLYMVDQADADAIDIDVREKHNAACGGDPGTAPRLFSFKLERATGRLTTDALDPADPEFKPID